jgi:hypothetical protein
MARARKGRSGAFLERTASEWRALGVPKRVYDVYIAAPVLGRPALATKKALRPDEIERLRDIAAGEDTTDSMLPDFAERLLALHFEKGEC